MTLATKSTRTYGDHFDIFADFFSDKWVGSTIHKYPLDVIESDIGYEVKISLPGVEKGNLSVTLDKDTLVIEATTSETKSDKNKYLYRGIKTGSYKKHISVKDYGVDPKKISSSYKNGILTISLPKHKEAKPQTISVEMEG
tara:strand:+ start:338 stop:760 length:423 start_codon:yes stop_codon:yes gene_type:complete